MGRKMLKNKLVQKSTTKNVISQALDSIYDELRGLSDSNIVENINFKHFLGKRFIEVIDNPQKYGKDAPAVLQERLGIKRKRDIDRAVLFAREYSDIDVGLYQHRYDNSKDAKITFSWSHWDKILVNYLTREDRENWMDLAVKNGWNCTELSQRLSATYNAGAKHGRKTKMPGTKVELLRKMSKPLEIFSNYYKKVWDDKDNPASLQLSHQLDDVSEETVTELHTLMDNLHEQQEQIQSMLTILKELDLDTLWTQKLREGTTTGSLIDEVLSQVTDKSDSDLDDDEDDTDDDSSEIEDDNEDFDEDEEYDEDDEDYDEEDFDEDDEDEDDDEDDDDDDDDEDDDEE